MRRPMTHRPASTLAENVPGQQRRQNATHEIILRRLTDEHGLVVPTRDPIRVPTKEQAHCGQYPAIGVPRTGGRPFFYRIHCHSLGCPVCAPAEAVRRTSRLRESAARLVGNSHASQSVLAYPLIADKPDGWLAIMVVPTPPDDRSKVMERISTRARRASTGGHRVNYVSVPCDGQVVILTDADLTEQKQTGHPLAPPTSGWWCDPVHAQMFLLATLESGSVNGRIGWSRDWDPGPRQSQVIVVSGKTPAITNTAYSILCSERYHYDASPFAIDPKSVLLDAIRRAESWVEHPYCSQCGATVQHCDTDVWWTDGHACCRKCDLIEVPPPLIDRGRTEREVEQRLEGRSMTFRPHWSATEHALERLDVTCAINGTSVLPLDQRKAD